MKLGFPGGLVVKYPPADAGNMSSIPGLGRSPGEGNGNPLQYSCLGNPMVRRNLEGPIHGVSKRTGHELANKQEQQPCEITDTLSVFPN